jgi:serpin B
MSICPRFKLKANYFLEEILADLGMPTAFSEMADFSGISPDRPLFISEVIYEAYVDVNERGGEAAAATAVEMAESVAGVAESEIPVFRADNPFLF